MKTTEDEINAQKEIKKDRKEKLESKLKEIMKKACPEKFDKDLYTGDFNEIIINFLKTDAMKDPPIQNMDDNKIIDNIDCIKAQIILFGNRKNAILEKIQLHTNNLSKERKDAALRAASTRGIEGGEEGEEEEANVGDFFAQFEQDESITPPKRKHIDKKIYYTKKLGFINEIIHKWREWNAEAIKINNELKNMGNTESESITEGNDNGKEFHKITTMVKYE